MSVLRFAVAAVAILTIPVALLVFLGMMAFGKITHQELREVMRVFLHWGAWR